MRGLKQTEVRRADVAVMFCIAHKHAAVCVRLNNEAKITAAAVSATRLGQ